MRLWTLSQVTALIWKCQASLLELQAPPMWLFFCVLGGESGEKRFLGISHPLKHELVFISRNKHFEFLRDRASEWHTMKPISCKVIKKLQSQHAKHWWLGSPYVLRNTCHGTKLILQSLHAQLIFFTTCEILRSLQKKVLVDYNHRERHSKSPLPWA